MTYEDNQLSVNIDQLHCFVMTKSVPCFRPDQILRNIFQRMLDYRDMSVD